MKTILFIAGTRPEAIKIAPVYLEAQKRQGLHPVLCAAGQHTDLFDDALSAFRITPEIRLQTMHPGQTLSQLTGHLFHHIGHTISQVQPDAVLVQGDTLTAFTGGYSGFLQQVPVYHIEAGLRTGDIRHPFPEEANRRALSIIASQHLAPTSTARDNLLKEGVSPEMIHVTGNTSIDALHHIRRTLAAESELLPAAPPADESPHILVTGHRRENFGPGLQNLCQALLRIVHQHPSVHITYPVHPNPAVTGPIHEALGHHPNIHLIPPQGYMDFIRLMLRSTFIISDSGGVQEEAPALGKPVLVTRTTTERPEAILCGANLLVGVEADTIVNAACKLLTQPDELQRMSAAGSPYGDGAASQRICDLLQGHPVQPFTA